MDYFEENRPYIELADMLLTDNYKVVYTHIWNDYQFGAFRSRFWQSEFQLLWIDRHHPIRDVQCLMDACGVALRLYHDFGCNWNMYQDIIRDEDYLPQPGCLFYFNDLSQFKLNEPREYNTLIEILEGTTDHWASFRKYFRTLIGLK